jgi:hypothetical protein
MQMSDSTARSYALLGHVITIWGFEAADTRTLPMRLDALLGPSHCDDQRRTTSRTTLLLRHEGTVWHLADESAVTAHDSLGDEEHIARILEWRAYSEAVRHSDMPLVLHAGAVARHGGAVLLPNLSGSGKTTLTLALDSRGWLPLTDDVCPLGERDGELVAIGCQRCCHVSESSMAALRAEGIDLEGPVGGMEGYYRPRRWGEPAPVQAIVIPRYSAHVATTLAPITQAECLARLANVTFEQEAAPTREKRRTAARLAARVPAFTLTYSALGEALDAFETLEAQLDTATMASGRHLASNVLAIT